MVNQEEQDPACCKRYVVPGLSPEFELGYEAGSHEHHVFWLRGPLGGVHIMAFPLMEGLPPLFGERWMGGVELHRHPAQGEQPSHEECWLLLGPCCHDGSSLQFTERVAPMLPPPAGQPMEDEVVHSVLRYCAFVYAANLKGDQDDAS